MNSQRKWFSAIGLLVLLSLLPSTGSRAATVQVYPGNNLSSITSSNPAGTTFVLNVGTYRQLAVVNPKNNDIYEASGAVDINGSELLSSWTASGSYWYVGGQTQKGPRTGTADGTHPFATYPEDLWVNGALFTHVSSKSALTSTTWYFDYSANKIWIKVNPSGKTIETSTMPNLFYDANSATGVVINGLQIEKYACPAQVSPIEGLDNDPLNSWTIENCTIDWCHGDGASAGNNCTIENNNIYDIGDCGIAGGGVTAACTIFNNQIDNCNYAGYDPEWEAGGIKVSASSDLSITYNYIHDNYGPGIWGDVTDTSFDEEYNQVYNNWREGIVYEISSGGTFANNICVNNGIGSGYATWLWGCQILIQNSSSCNVYDNSVWLGPTSGNGLGIINQDRSGPVATSDAIYDNNVTWEDDSTNNGVCGGATDDGYNAMFTSDSFSGNKYHVSPTNDMDWTWDNVDFMTFTSFQGYGEDTTGTIDTTITSPPAPSWTP